MSGITYMEVSTNSNERIRLYHFLSKKWALSDLQRRRLKISRLLDLNDPFEFSSLNMADPDFRKSVRDSIRDIANEAGMICFSENWNSPVQWAHYGDRHRGLCLGFSISRDSAKKVNYVKERGILFGSLTQPMIMKLMTTKYIEWAYEKEYRLFLELKEREGDGNYYADFGPDLQLEEVIVGANCDVDREELRMSLGERDDSVRVWKVRPAFKSFNMTRKLDWAF